MQGLAELDRPGEEDYILVQSTIKGAIREVAAETCRAILVYAARRSPVEADAYADGYVRATLEALKRDNYKCAGQYGGIFLIQVGQDGVKYVRAVARRLFDEAEFNEINLGVV
jgi:hypothetical protein